jgi:hypothetical protein
MVCVRRLRILGFAMFAYGAVMLALLFTPWEAWAANHSIAAYASATDKRAGNSIDTAVDRPISIAGDCVVMFAGLWIGLLVPRMLKKFKDGYTPNPTMVTDREV